VKERQKVMSDGDKKFEVWEANGVEAISVLS